MGNAIARLVKIERQLQTARRRAYRDREVEKARAFGYAASLVRDAIRDLDPVREGRR